MHLGSVPFSSFRIVHVLAAGTLGLVACGPGDAGRDVVPHESGDVAESSSEGAVIDRTGQPDIVFLGTSLTAGYGLDDPDLAFPGLIQRRIDSLGLEFHVVNAGVSGDTSAGGLDRLRFLLESPIRVLVLELGANDGLRGLSVDALRSNLDQIIQRTRARNPDVEIVLVGMEAPPNLGQTYTSEFRKVYPELAEKHGVELVPFLLDGVAGVPSLNQSDFIHPTAEGYQVVMETVWSSLGPILEGL